MLTTTHPLTRLPHLPHSTLGSYSTHSYSPQPFLPHFQPRSPLTSTRVRSCRRGPFVARRSPSPPSQNTRAPPQAPIALNRPCIHLGTLSLQRDDNRRPLTRRDSPRPLRRRAWRFKLRSSLQERGRTVHPHASDLSVATIRKRDTRLPIPDTGGPNNTLGRLIMPRSARAPPSSPVRPTPSST